MFFLNNTCVIKKNFSYLRNYVGQHIAFDFLDHVFKAKLTFFQPLQLNKINRLIFHEAANRIIEVLMLFFKRCQLFLKKF